MMHSLTPSRRRPPAAFVCPASLLLSRPLSSASPATSRTRPVMTLAQPAHSTSHASPPSPQTRQASAPSPSPATSPSPSPSPSPSSSSSPPAASPPPIRLIHGVEAYLDALRDAGDALVVLKVFAPWCRSCRGLEPKVARLSREFADVVFLEMDYEKNKALCYRLGVVSMPTFVLYKGAAGEVDKFSCGPLRAHVIREKIEQVLAGECAYEP